MNVYKRIKLFFLFHARNYREILALTSFNERDKKSLDPINVRYHGQCSFYTKNFHQAEICFELLKELNKLNKNDSNYMAYIYARHNEKDKAIASWCTALEKDRNNRIAKKALDYIRNKGRIINLIDDEYFDELVKKEPFIFPVKFLIISFIMLLVSIIIGFGVFISVIKIKEYYRIHSSTNEIDKIFIPYFNTGIIEKPKDPKKKYSYNEKEIIAKFDKIKKDIINNKVVEAQIDINRIKISNASLDVKYKVEILESFIVQPDYGFFKNEISFIDFLKEKELYNNIFIIWEGRVVNLKITKTRISFNLIIGDEKNGIIDGIIPVIFEKDVLVNNNDRIKVFGKIFIDESNIYIKGLYRIKNE